ncbi:DUF4232 domain-containing protein [Streptacidiphilus sp. 4-A2]|nr:DUF4232 domain-containing protein [Streptacidiphilus sp. 4-A2]
MSTKNRVLAASAALAAAASLTAGLATTASAATPHRPAAPSHCRAANTSYRYGPDSGAQVVGEQGFLHIELTNTGSATCVMRGYPGVDLKSGNRTWSLERSTAALKTVTLKHGQSTSFDIAYLPYVKGSGTAFKVTSMLITLPNDTTSHRMAWDWQPVLLQDGATHPGTWVGPVGR